MTVKKFKFTHKLIYGVQNIRGLWSKIKYIIETFIWNNSGDHDNVTLKKLDFHGKYITPKVHCDFQTYVHKFIKTSLHRTYALRLI